MIPNTFPEDPSEAIVSEVEAVTNNPRFRNYIAQSHSREVLQRLNIQQSDWPRYSAFDEELHYTAHFLLWQGLQLKGDAQYALQANEYIKQACEILEFLYTETADGTPVFDKRK